MPKSDPTKNKEFKRVLGNLLKAPPKTHSEMKICKPIKTATDKRRARKKKDND